MKEHEEVPKGLTALEHARKILEEILGWPSKGNIELLADCLTAIAKAKKLTPEQAYKYMVRAIGLAKEQDITVDRMFFMNGEYVNVRPVSRVSYFVPNNRDREKAEASRKEYFDSPEYKSFLERMRKDHSL